ncbi:MAG: phosphoenolpyruvate--protein phosphotransferase [Planctomycetota bacterium]|nr:phosphoenolpyruvate--protein phosphotransferase [Planctomycetota bacterium]
MEILKGIPVSPGVYIGEAFLLVGEEVRIPERFVPAEKMDSEAKRFDDACAKVGTQLDAIRGDTESQLGPNFAAILSVQTQLLRDPSLRQRILDKIRKDHYSAEYAVAKTLRDLAKVIAASDSPVIAQRASDIFDLEKRLLNDLLGEQREDLGHLQRPVALIAHDLGPSQTAALDRTKVRAFATDVGGRTSHTAILARAHEIPAVVGLETITTDVAGGETVIIDGNRGIVILRPDERTLARYRKIQQEFEAFEATLIKDKDLPSVTQDGREIHVLGNIEFPEEVRGVLQHGAQGVGLFRTEFLYLKSGVMPDENDHFEAYRKSVSKLNGRPLTVRTLDLGADKIDRNQAYSEPNPFLGLRSIRLSMKRPENFRTQVRAILRSSTLGKVRLLLPMITAIDELRWAKGVVEEVKAELAGKKVPFDEKIPVGIMVEVPSAALQAQAMARECDFLSIGTNDLVQYTLAVDRGNEHVAHLYTPAHPAVIQLIKRVVDAGLEFDKPVGMCGEMAGEPVYTILLLGLGLSELSVAPPSIPSIKRIIRTLKYSDCQSGAQEVLKMDDANQVLDYLKELARKLLPSDIRFGGI